MSDNGPDDRRVDPNAPGAGGTGTPDGSRAEDEATVFAPRGDEPPAPSLKRLGDFEILRELGRGGMGVVYEAHQISLRRRVALKVLPPGLGMSPEARKRFEREAQAAGKLHHTNIVPVHAIGQDDGHHYYAMELIEGQALDQLLRQLKDDGPGPLLAQTVTTGGAGQQQPPPATVSQPATTSAVDSTASLGDTSAGSRYWFNTVAKLIAEVADALDYAHGQGVIHRDIKPANLMLSSEGRLCVADFGLARVVQEPGMTVSGSLLGTPAYMSPEQIAGGRVKLDHRTDVYSLGAVLYELLTLERPFAGDNREEVLTAIMAKEPRSPRKINAKIPQDLETICLKALEKDADRRYATAGELALDLRQYLHGGLITARRASLGRRAWKLIRRHPVAATSVLAAVLIAGLGTVAWQAMAGRQASDIGRTVSDARLMLTRGEYREALAAVDTVLANAPDNVDARLLRARIDVHRWHWWDAVEAGRAVLENDPDNWEAHLLIVAAAKKGGLYSVPTTEHLAAVEKHAPDTADAFFLRGWVAWQEDRPREAIEWLDKALELDPGHAMALEVRSDTYVDLKDLPAALADAERLAIARPRGPEGPQQAGYVYMRLHDEARALEKLDRAIELDSELPGGYLQRASIHRDRGAIDEQIADLTRAVELDPEGGHYGSRAAAYIAQGDYDSAIADYRRDLEINPDDLWAYRGLFVAEFSAGRRDEARAVIGELEARAQSWVDEAGLGWYHEELAYLYGTIGDHERAIAEAERAVELRPDWFRAHWRLAVARREAEGQSAITEDCDRMAGLALDTPSELLDRAGAMSGMCGRTDLALADYAKATELAPNWAEPYQLRGFLLRREKRFEEALADLDRAIDLTPSWASLLYNRGSIYSTMGRFEQALADYERCAELGVEGNRLREEQALALQRLGREAEALQVLDDFVEKHPDNAGGHMARASLLAVELGRVDDALESADRAVELEPGLAMPYWRRAAHGSATPGRCEQVQADHVKARELGTGPAWAALHADMLVLNFCYSCPDLCDPAEALELAREAVDYDAGSSFNHMVHGSALYRLGRFEEAREALLRGAELSIRADDHINFFFLAMTSFESGNPREARKYYDTALASMNAANFSKNPISINVRDEAAVVLGLR